MAKYKLYRATALLNINLFVCYKLIVRKVVRFAPRIRETEIRVVRRRESDADLHRNTFPRI